MSEATEPALLIDPDRTAITTRRVVMFSSRDKYFCHGGGLKKNENNHIVVTGEVGETKNVRLDFEAMIESGDRVHHVTASPRKEQTFGANWAEITFDRFTDCPQECVVTVVFLSGERTITRFIARTFHHFGVGSAGSHEQTRGGL